MSAVSQPLRFLNTPDGFPQMQPILAQRAQPDRLFEDRIQLYKLYRLGEKIGSSKSERLHSSLHVSVPGYDHDRKLRPDLLRLFEK